MTKLDSIPESQLTALMDLILEKATEVQKEKERSTEKGRSAPERWPIKAISILAN